MGPGRPNDGLRFGRPDHAALERALHVRLCFPVASVLESNYVCEIFRLAGRFREAKDALREPVAIAAIILGGSPKYHGGQCFHHQSVSTGAVSGKRYSRTTDCWSK